MKSFLNQNKQTKLQFFFYFILISIFFFLNSNFVFAGVQPSDLANELAAYLKKTEAEAKYLRFDGNTSPNPTYYEAKIGTANYPLYVSALRDKVAFGGNTLNGKLTVNGGYFSVTDANGIAAKKLTLNSSGTADYVFEKDYNLMPLPELESYIYKNKALPGIPTDSIVAKNGVDVGELQKKLLEKIEELTLYILQLKKENTQLNNKIDNLNQK